jgi:hypothetical protein
VHEHHLVLPGLNRRYLEDVTLSIHGHPAFINASNRSSPDNVCLYIDGVDVTQFYIAELKRVLDLQDQARLHSQYSTALDKWIELAQAMGAAYGNIAKDIADRPVLLSVTPFSNLVDQLGNRSAGNAGFLHVFNFLHNLVAVPGISLRRVIDAANNAAGHGVLDPGAVRMFTISNGPCRLFVAGTTVPTSFGGVFVQGDLEFHDPLADRVKRLEDRVDELERTLNEELAEIFDRLSSDGPIARAVAAAREAASAAGTSIGNARAEIQSHTAQIAGLQATARDLKNAVDAL